MDPLQNKWEVLWFCDRPFSVCGHSSGSKSQFSSVVALWEGIYDN